MKHLLTATAALEVGAGLALLNAQVIAALAYAVTALGPLSGCQWPAAAIHSVMTIWCVTHLTARQRHSTTPR